MASQAYLVDPAHQATPGDLHPPASLKPFHLADLAHLALLDHRDHRDPPVHQETLEMLVVMEIPVVLEPLDPQDQLETTAHLDPTDPRVIPEFQRYPRRRFLVIPGHREIQDPRGLTVRPAMMQTMAIQETRVPRVSQAHEAIRAQMDHPERRGILVLPDLQENAASVPSIALWMGAFSSKMERGGKNVF